ncbi:MAG: adenylate kinase [Candidatus Melainabacteria bacterium]|nr:MAG: adenylate kinase [Candidatus Melainabacteria bacterium]
MRILFLGPQGSGKGTQAKKLHDKTGLPHLSSGDLLRQAVADGTPAGKRAKQYMEAGKLVPDDVLIAMFGERLPKPEYNGGYILDGFPRNLAQAKALDVLLSHLNQPLTHVLNLTIDDGVAMERMTGRRICSNKSCGAIYHIKTAPPKHDAICDLCGSVLMQRSDDTPEACRERLKIYHDETEPLVSYYQAKHILHVVDANADPETVFAKIAEALKLEKMSAK